LKPLRMKMIELFVTEIAAPVVLNVHAFKTHRCRGSLAVRRSLHPSLADRRSQLKPPRNAFREVRTF
jgi:hypothetical protein